MIAMTTNKLFWYLKAGAIVTLIFIGILGSVLLQGSIDPDSMQGSVGLETLKSLLHLLVVIIIGGVVTYLFKSTEATRQQEQAFLTIRMALFDKLNRLYHEVKDVREELRKNNLSTKGGNKPDINSPRSKEAYYKEMDRLQALRRRIEELKREAIAFPAFNQYKMVRVRIAYMEKYLGKIVSEYLMAKKDLDDNKPVVFENLSYLVEFTGDVKKFKSEKDEEEEDIKLHNSFKEDFSEQFGKVSADLASNV